MDSHYHIFVSYAHQDQVLVMSIVNDLKKHYDNIWIDEENVLHSEKFRDHLVRALKESDVILFFSSQHSNASKWVQKEIILATDLNKTIIPILLDQTPYNDSIRLDLAGLNFANACVVNNNLTESLTASLKQLEIQKKKKRIRLYYLSLFLFVLLLCATLIGCYITHKPDPLIDKESQMETLHTMSHAIDSLYKLFPTNSDNFVYYPPISEIQTPTQKNKWRNLYIMAKTIDENITISFLNNNEKQQWKHIIRCVNRYNETAKKYGVSPQMLSNNIHTINDVIDNVTTITPNWIGNIQTLNIKENITNMHDTTDQNSIRIVPQFE